jgi:hypothetical protein
VQAVRSVPLHIPRQVVPVHATRAPRGFPLTGTHWPTVFVSAQASHWPPHARLQQTLSAQLPLVHSVPIWHRAPFAFWGTHTAFPLQNWPLGQGLAALQPPEHRIASAHRLLMHGMVIAAVQAPALLHTVAEVAVPLVHDAAVQVVAPSGNVHFVPSVPPQLPLHGAVPAQAVRVARGVPVTGVHLPTWVVSLQLSHWPVHALSQQTVSMQLPVEHSAVVVHFEPLAFLGWQIPLASQKVPAEHGLVALHMSRQVIVSAHWLLRQVVAAGVVQPPLPLHRPGLIIIAFTQLDGAQVVVAPG